MTVDGFRLRLGLVLTMEISENKYLDLQMPKTMDPLLPPLFSFGYGAIVLGTSEVQVDV